MIADTNILIRRGGRMILIVRIDGGISIIRFISTIRILVSVIMLLKKSLGQHFLRDRHILEKIAATAELSKEDTVLEVGPGEGTLTELLLEKAGRVIAVEKDTRLMPVLCEKFQHERASGRLELIHADILSVDSRGKRQEARYKIVANLPYYI
ncbi:MAG: 16S rRNA (adenine1518-N6/adenine1519-N6)-dimethyltransferase, partial [Parcubacteria group bacterium Greene0416_79]